MKKKIMALLGCMVTVASIHARSFFITVTNDTPYTIQHVASMSGKGAQAITRPGVESTVEADANATDFPTFTLLDDNGKVLRKVMPYMPNAAYHEPIFHDGDDITFIGYGGEIVITHNGLAVPFREVE